MPSLLSTRRFTIYIDGVSDQTVTPVVSGLKYRWQLEEGTRFYRKKLSTKLLFKGADYTYFKTIYDGGACSSVTVLIELYCGSAWREEYNGKIVIGQGSYHLDRCEVEYDIQPNDAYDCFKRVLKTPLNWLSLTDPVTAKPAYGTNELETCSFSGIEFGSPLGAKMFYKDCWSGGAFDTTEDPEPDASTKWRPVQHDKVYDPDNTPELTIETVWAREAVTQVGTPPGSNWVNIGGNDWVRPIPLGSVYVDSLFPYLTGDRYLYGFFNHSNTISNGRLLNDLLPAVVTALGCASVTDVYSDFLNITPPGDAPANDAYAWAGNYAESILLFQKSDIVNEDAANDATTLNMTLQDFLNSLRDAFNLYWSLEPIGGGDYALRIEHWTYYEAANGLDITALDGGVYTRGNNQFTAETQVPPAEVFRFQEAHSTRFLESQIQYPAACSDGEENIVYEQKDMSTDVGGLMNNPAASLQGFVLVSTVHDYGDGSYLIDNTNNILNGAMAWDELHDALWKYGRYHTEATSTASGTFAVDTTRRFKEQQRFSFKYCCEATDFDPVQLLQSGLGWGQIKDIEHDTERDLMNVTLLHT